MEPLLSLITLGTHAHDSSPLIFQSLGPLALPSYDDKS